MKDYISAEERLTFPRSWTVLIVEIIYFIGFLFIFLLGGIYV